MKFKRIVIKVKIINLDLKKLCDYSRVLDQRIMNKT